MSGIVAGEKDDGTDDLLGLWDVFERRLLKDLFAAAGLTILSSQQSFGFDEAGSERVHTHFGGKGVSVGFGQANDSVLARCVLRGPGTTRGHDAGANVHNGAAALIEHAGADFVDHEHGPLNIYSQDVIDGLFGDLAPRVLA